MSELSCLHSRPDLIASCSSLLRSVWPCTKTERLQLLETENCTGFPCSLVLIDQKENKPGSVIGHIRVLQCPEPPESVYFEALCIDQSRVGTGLGVKVMKHAEEYAVSTLGLKQAFLWTDISMKGFYSKLSYQEFTKFGITTVGGNLLGQFSVASNWQGNVPQSGWESEYEDGHFATEDDLREKIIMRKYLTKL
ncbi:N-alpha-acetyltransferase 80-like [Asterias amurensis]|uniref:N-alpha-acetyltransferase 80-like n=1 Tax=Asterias amurensis TaxID=7602 RepID=UPI003AB45B5B